MEKSLFHSSRKLNNSFTSNRMTPEFISQLLEKSLSVAILVVGGYFMIRYFMQEIQRKDAQNQANLDRFISLVEKTNLMMESFRTELG